MLFGNQAACFAGAGTPGLTGGLGVVVVDVVGGVLGCAGAAGWTDGLGMVVVVVDVVVVDVVPWEGCV